MFNAFFKNSSLKVDVQHFFSIPNMFDIYAEWKIHFEDETFNNKIIAKRRATYCQVGIDSFNKQKSWSEVLGHP